MPKENIHRKLYRIRRTVRSAAEQADGRALPRAIWGVAPSAAAHVYNEKRQQYWDEVNGLELEIAEELSHCRQLEIEAERYRRRLIALRGVIKALRTKFARERAARAVLAARLLDQQSPERWLAEPSTREQLSLEHVRTSADLYREHEQLRGLIMALYRSVAGRGTVPANLDIRDNLHAPPLEDMGDDTVTPRQPEWHQFLLGKVVGRTLIASDGRTLATEGERICAEGIAAVEQEGLLFDLILSMRLPVVLDEL